MARRLQRRVKGLRKQIRDRPSECERGGRSPQVVLDELCEQTRTWEQDRRVLDESAVRLPDDPPLGTHGDGTRMVSLCGNVAQKVGLRSAQAVLRIVFDWLGLEQKIPDWITIRNWMQRLSWLKEAKGDSGESKRRSESSFLCPVDADGCVCDFHGLRHTFISNLVAGGVHPKVAQQLARHSIIGLTMDRYTHLRLSDMTAGLAALPLIVGSEPVSCRATGTLDESVESFGCTNGCTRTGATNRYQPSRTCWRTVLVTK